MKKESDPGSLVRGSDLGIRIRISTKMSRIPNTGIFTDKFTRNEQKKITESFIFFRACNI